MKGALVEAASNFNLEQGWVAVFQNSAEKKENKPPDRIASIGAVQIRATPQQSTTPLDSLSTQSIATTFAAMVLDTQP